MKIRDLEEAAGVGRITKQNQTPDVGPNEVSKQAAKWGFKVDKDGYPPLLREDVASDLKSTVINLVQQTQDAKLLAKILNALKSVGLPEKLSAAFASDQDASKLVDKLTQIIVNMDGTAEEKIKFAEDFKKGFVDTKKLLDGAMHTFEELIPNPFALEVFKTLAIYLTAQGVGPGEVALSILSPNITHAGRKSGGGDIVVNGKPIEVKTKVSKGGRWVDARKAKMNMPSIKAAFSKLGIETGDRLGIARYVNEIRPQINDVKQLKQIAKIIAAGNFAFVNTSNLEKALVQGDANAIKEAFVATGFENYKAYAKFEGMLLINTGQQWISQYFSNFDSMRGNIRASTAYLYGPEGETMPQIELSVAR